MKRMTWTKARSSVCVCVYVCLSVYVDAYTSVCASAGACERTVAVRVNESAHTHRCV